MPAGGKSPRLKENSFGCSYSWAVGSNFWFCCIGTFPLSFTFCFMFHFLSIILIKSVVLYSYHLIVCPPLCHRAQEGCLDSRVSWISYEHTLLQAHCALRMSGEWKPGLWGRTGVLLSGVESYILYGFADLALMFLMFSSLSCLKIYELSPTPFVEQWRDGSGYDLQSFISIHLGESMISHLWAEIHMDV